MNRRPPRSTLLPYTALFRSNLVFIFFNSSLLHPFNIPTLSKSIKLVAANPHTTSACGLFFSAKSLRSEEHTSELQSRQYLVCRLLLEKKSNCNNHNSSFRTL